MTTTQKAIVAGAVALVAWQLLKKKPTVTGADAAAATTQSPAPIPREAQEFWAGGNAGPPPLSPDEINARQYWAEGNEGPPPATGADAFRTP